MSDKGGNGPTFYQSLTNSELLVYIKKSDKKAFNEVTKRYWKTLYAEAFKRCESHDKSNDIVQNVLCDLWEKREKREIINLEHYLKVAIRYQVLAIFRKERSMPRFEEPMEHMAVYYLQADSAINFKELTGCVQIWLTTVPDKRAEIFRLKNMNDLTTREISELLNISQKTVQNQLVTSAHSLRKFITKRMLILLGIA